MHKFIEYRYCSYNCIKILSACIIMLVLFCFMPDNAYAATLQELSDQLSDVQVAAAEEQTAYQEACNSLANTLDIAYKQGNINVIDLLSAPEDIQKMLGIIKYGNAMVHEMYMRTEQAQQAAADAKSAVDAAQELYDRKNAQEQSLKNADSIHFCQASEPWGSMHYWRGTMTLYGCGLVSYTVAIDILTGRNETPDQVLSERGDWAGTEQTIDATTGSKDGKTHAQDTKRLYDVNTVSLSTDGNRMETLNNALNAESVVQICASGRAFKNNDGMWRYSGGGHYIIVYRRADDGGYMVQDSTWTDKGTAVHYSVAEMNTMLSHTYSMTQYSN